MSAATQSVLDEWSLPAALTVAILLIALFYVRGWFAIRHTRREQFSGWRLASFLLGLAVLWLAIASPLDAFADALLSAHMVEHLLLMSVVPPLLLFGLPVVPLLRGLPVFPRNALAGPLLRLSSLRRLRHWLVMPTVAWLAMNLTFWHGVFLSLMTLPWRMSTGTNLSTPAFWQRRFSSGGVSASRGPLHRTARLGFTALPDLGRPGEHCALGNPGLLQPPRLRVLLEHSNPSHVSPLSDQILGPSLCGF